MDWIDTSSLLTWLTQYGPLTLYILMALGIIAFPVPEETLMVFTGILIQQETVHFLPTAIAALLGAMTGITVSYFLGRGAEKLLSNSLGKRLGITENRLKIAHSWFEHFGKWALLIGYYIPGLRHFIGIAAGIAYLPYREFALFAYTGALIWVTTFISIGYFGGEWFFSLKLSTIRVDEIAFVILVIALVAFLTWRYFRVKEKRTP